MARAVSRLVRLVQGRPPQTFKQYMLGVLVCRVRKHDWAEVSGTPEYPVLVCQRCNHQMGF